MEGYPEMIAEWREELERAKRERKSGFEPVVDIDEYIYATECELEFMEFCWNHRN